MTKGNQLVQIFYFQRRRCITTNQARVINAENTAKEIVLCQQGVLTILSLHKDVTFALVLHQSCGNAARLQRLVQDTGLSGRHYWIDGSNQLKSGNADVVSIVQGRS